MLVAPEDALNKLCREETEMNQDTFDVNALVGGNLANLAMKIIAALLILIVGLWLVKLLVKLVKKGKKFRKQAPEVQTFLSSALKVLPRGRLHQRRSA